MGLLLNKVTATSLTMHIAVYLSHIINHAVINQSKGFVYNASASNRLAIYEDQNGAVLHVVNWSYLNKVVHVNYIAFTGAFGD